MMPKTRIIHKQPASAGKPQELSSSEKKDSGAAHGLEHTPEAAVEESKTTSTITQSWQEPTAH